MTNDTSQEARNKYFASVYTQLILNGIGTGTALQIAQDATNAMAQVDYPEILVG